MCVTGACHHIRPMGHFTSPFLVHQVLCESSLRTKRQLSEAQGPIQDQYKIGKVSTKAIQTMELFVDHGKLNSRSYDVVCPIMQC